MPKRTTPTNGTSTTKKVASNISLQSQIGIESGDTARTSNGATSSINLLNYNQRLMRQNAIDAYGWHEVLPITRLPDTDPNVPLEFRFDAIENSFSDFFGGFLDYSFSVWHEDGSALGVNELVCPINLCGLTYWNRVELWTADLQLLGHHSDFSFISYNHAMLYATTYAKDYAMQSWGWYPDSANQFNTVSITGDVEDQNKGARDRLGLIAGSKTANFIVPVQFDLGGVVNLIPDKADLQLRYFRNTPEFFLMKGLGNANEYKIKLERAVFRLIRYQLAPGELTHLNRVLNSSGFLLAATQVVIKKRLFIGGEMNLMFTCFRELLPSAILVWMVDQRAVNGDYRKNPFEYALNNIRKITVFKNEVPYPLSNGLSVPKITNMELAYFYLLRNLHGGSPTFIPVHMNGGYGIFCFDMTAGNTSNSAITSRTETGTIRIEIDLAAGLIDPAFMYVQGLFPKNVKYSAQRELSIIDVL